MDGQRFIEYLQHFGLTRQEAVLYRQLLAEGKQTGYEIAKQTGISRSNAYSSLASLVEKGAAYVAEETAKKYIAVKPEEFCENCIRRMQEEEAWILENLPGEKVEEEGYITIEGAANIQDKVKNLLLLARERVYFSCTAQYLQEFSEELEKLLQEKKKVVVITDAEVSLPGARIYLTQDKGKQIGMITDSRYVLTGEYGTGSMNTCLYSGQKNFVMLFKTALANEIKLITLSKGENENE